MYRGLYPFKKRRQMILNDFVFFNFHIILVGKIYGALLMFEHWKAYKNRQQDTKDGFPTGKPGSRAESFASIVSVISQRMANTKSQLSLRPGLKYNCLT